jgi:tetratricopeptide (TPR) repeat protein
MTIGFLLRRKRAILPTTLLLIAVAGCSRSPEAQSAKFMEAGKKFLQNNNGSRAVLQFQNAVRATPKNPDAYYQLGLAFLRVDDLAKGVASLKKAVELNPKHVEARLKLAELMSNGDEALIKGAQQRLQELLDEVPSNPEALHALALTELKLGDPQDAIEHLGQAIAAAPDKLMLAVTLAQVKLDQKDPDGAEAVLKKACADSPKSVDAIVVLGRFYSIRNRFPEAEQQFQRALALDANHPAATLDLAMLERRTGRKAEAEQLFKRLSNQPTKSSKPLYAFFLMQEGRRNESIREFERLFKEDPEDRLARTRLVSAYQSANRAADAENVLREALKKNSKDLDALLQRSELFLINGKYNQAEADLNQVVHLKPESAEIHYVLSKLHQARGEAFGYRQELSNALQRNAYLFSVRMELVQALLNSASGGGAASAMQVLDQTPEFQKKSTAYFVHRNWTLWALQDMAGMRKGIDAGLAKDRSPELLVQDGLWKLRSGNPAGARSSLEQVLKLRPSDLRALNWVKQSYVAQNQPALAVQKVKEYASREPKSALVQEFLGQVLMANGDRAGARAAFTTAKTADPQLAAADLFLTQLDVADGKLDLAEERLKSLIAANGNNAIAHLWLGNVEEKKGNHTAALEQYRKAVEVDPTDAQALNNLAYALAEYANAPDRALGYATKAKELAPDNPQYADTLGWIYYRKGLYPVALTQLERAAANDGNVVWKYHLAMAYAKAGDVRKGRAVLDAALKRNPSVPEAKVAKEMLGDTR